MIPWLVWVLFCSKLKMMQRLFLKLMSLLILIIFLKPLNKSRANSQYDYFSFITYGNILDGDE